MEPWISVDDYRRRFDVEDPDDIVTSRIEAAILGASAWVEQQIGRRVLESDYLRRFSGNGTTDLHLPFPPIVQVTEVEVDGVVRTVGTVDDAFDNPAVIFNDDSKLVLLNGWPCGRYNIRVEWTAGYLRQSVTEDLKRLTETAAAIIFKEARRAGDKSASTGRGGSSEYVRELQGLERSALKALVDWRSLEYDKGAPLPGDSGSELGVFAFASSELG